jgi:hypothetical protein
MKKKVIALVIETELTNEQLEESLVRVLCCDAGADETEKANAMEHVARNVRVLDSDEVAS